VIEAVDAAIRGRRSVGRVAPGPLPRDLVNELVEAALWAPNHHLTHPWRFVVLAGAARREVGLAHARAVARSKRGHPPEGLAKEAALLERAPVVIACAVAGRDDPVQAREDRDTVAAGIQNLLLAAHARGLAAIWRTGVMPDEPEVREALGLAPVDVLVGMVYVGRPADGSSPPPAPARPERDRVSVWRGW
jgi:nitroreductase